MRSMWIFQHRVCIMGMMCGGCGRVQMHDTGMMNTICLQMRMDKWRKYLQADQPEYNQPCWKFQVI